MAVPLAVASAVRAGAQAAPAVLARANEALAKVTGGKVKNLSDLTTYVGSNPNRLKVVTEAMVKAGFAPDQILPDDIVGKNAAIAQIRSDAQLLVGNMQTKYESSSDQTLGANDIAADVIRARRVRAALDVFGNEERYFLCNPNGGIPASEFAWYRAMRAAL